MSNFHQFQQSLNRPFFPSSWNRGGCDGGSRKAHQMSFRHSLPHTQLCPARVGFHHRPVSHALLYPRKQVRLLYVYHSFWISNKHGVMYLHELNLKFSPRCDCSSVQPKTNGEHVEESGVFCGDVFVQQYSEDHTLSQEKNSSIWSQKLPSLESDVSLMSSVYVSQMRLIGGCQRPTDGL